MRRDVLLVALLAAACNDDPYPNKSEVNWCASSRCARTCPTRIRVRT